MTSHKLFQVFFLIVFLTFVASIPGCSTGQSFQSSRQAMDALVTALRNDDIVRVRSILGKEGDEILYSGDAVEDRSRVEDFLAAFDENHIYSLNDDGSVTVVVGDNLWPLPIPIVRNPWTNGWQFDVKAGKEEILNRRIGGNELDAIQTCLAIVDAQRDYAALDPERLGGPVYAQRFLSEAGKKNGLYWETPATETPSPLGPAITKAEAEGYVLRAGQPQPYHGYYFRVLKSQGPSAPGGAMDYMADGKMSRGFAIVAYPAEYGNSGIATFIVNQLGILYSCDLGSNTEKVASQMTSFDPDRKWTPVTDGDTVIVRH